MKDLLKKQNELITNLINVYDDLMVCEITMATLPNALFIPEMEEKRIELLGKRSEIQKELDKLAKLIYEEV